MNRTSNADASRRSSLPVFMAAVILLAALAALSLLTLGFVGVIVALTLLLAAFIGFQYLLWGWWLGPLLLAQERVREESSLREPESEAN